MAAPSIPSKATSTKPGFTQASLWSVAGSLALVGAALAAFKLRSQPLWIDFLTMWTGGRMARGTPHALYDFAADDRAQAWLLGAAARDRPFPYPPSTLLIFGPLGRLSFSAAGGIWIGATLIAFVAVTAFILPPRRRVLGVALIMLSPAAVWAAVSGQCVFLLGALAIGGIAQLRQRPILAGSLLGVAAAFKPSVLLMAPVAMAAGGRGWAILGAALGGFCVIAGSLVVYGAQPWFDWVSVAPLYLAHITRDPKFYSSIIAPSGLATELGLTGVTSMLWRVTFALLGVVMTALVFRRTQDLAPRLTALFGGSLLATPYAMNYESVLLAPGAVIALMTSTGVRQRLLTAMAFLALVVAGFPNLGATALLVFLAFAVFSFRPEHEADARGYPPSVCS
jgi:hypothetical protein